MKITRLYDSENGNETYGIVKKAVNQQSNNGKDENYDVMTREEITYQTGIPIPQNIMDFMFEGWYQEIQKILGDASGSKDGKKLDFNYARKLSSFDILPPLRNPPKIICLAFNYKDHAREQNLLPPDEPAIIMKPRTSLGGPRSDIICPSFVSKLDYEIELALIIGKTCKNVSQKDAFDCIFGYMILNDVSARDIQAKDKQFTRAKGFDTFAPCGPWVTTKEEIGNPQNLKMITKVNNETRQNSSTSQMNLQIPVIISSLSKAITLEKGDIISTGTPAGVMLNKEDAVYLKQDDKIEMEIEDLGKLENMVKFVDSQD